MAVTPAIFKAIKTQFSAVDDEVVQYYLDLAGLWVTDAWPEASRDAALTAATCHLMTLEGQGTDAASQMFADGLHDFQVLKSGTLSLSRFQKNGERTSFTEWLNLTACGSMFYQLAGMVYGGPRVILGGVNSVMPSYGARDWPPAFYQV